jgi:hypothetical protein
VPYFDEDQIVGGDTTFGAERGGAVPCSAGLAINTLSTSANVDQPCAVAAEQTGSKQWFGHNA